MKKIIFFVLVPLLSFGQIQIGESINFYGTSMSMSSDGSTVAIGSGNDAGLAIGKVKVYRNVSGNWIQLGNDINGINIFDFCGPVSLSADGNTIAVGTPKYDEHTTTTLPYLRVFRNISGSWIQIGSNIVAQAINDGTGVGGRFSLSADGNTLSVGSSGAVRVYKNISGTWSQDSNNIVGSGNVSISADGETLAISNSNNGVRVFRNVSGIWTQIGNTFYSGFNDISLSGDGLVLAIGNQGYNVNGQISAGQVVVFKNISDTWTQIGTAINGTVASNYTGEHVSLSFDGSVLAFNDRYTVPNDNRIGRVRFYKNIADTWSPLNSVLGQDLNENLGMTAVKLSADGNILATMGFNKTRIYNISPDVLISSSFTQEKFILYPNPAKSILNISVDENVLFEKATIYNTLGQLIKTENKKEINVSDLSKGSYFIEVITDKGKATKIFIVE